MKGVFNARVRENRIYSSTCMQKEARKSLKFIKMLPSQDLIRCPSNQLLSVSLSSSCHMKEKKKKVLRRLETLYNYLLTVIFSEVLLAVA